MITRRTKNRCPMCDGRGRVEWESYFLYTPGLRPEMLCYYYGRLCYKCEEPECDAAQGWMKKKAGKKR